MKVWDGADDSLWFSTLVPIVYMVFRPEDIRR